MDGLGGVMTMPMSMAGPQQRMMRPQMYQRPNARNFQPRPGSELAKQLEANPDSTIIGQNVLFDGKRMRKAMHRKTVDYNSAVIQYLENRVWQRDARDARAIQPDSLYQIDIPPPCSMLENPMNCVTTKFIRTSTNKFRCPIFCVAWTPEGRRLITGASSGEFTLWNGLTFNFETILQAHDTSVRAMVWSHNDAWMVTADHSGFIKYWQSNMNNVKMYQGHKDPIRGVSFCPTDSKFSTCSDDGTVRIWDFMRCHEERILRGHGADVKCVDWHPQKALIASGSKDNQQPIKLWDPKSGTSLATIHAHKSTVMELKWNKNGNWLITASRDHLLKLFDIRNMKEEIQTFKGHKKEATAVSWHPIHEGLFVSGGSDGSIMFWNVGTDREIGAMEEAHEGMVWTLAWHPLGHILATGSNDHTTKFWTRNRPGDRMRDKYNLNTLPGGSEHELPEFDTDATAGPILPGMGQIPDPVQEENSNTVGGEEEELPSIPGLDWSADSSYFKEHEVPRIPVKKVPYARPIPWDFEKAWMTNKLPVEKKRRKEKRDRGDRREDRRDRDDRNRDRRRDRDREEEEDDYNDEYMDEENMQQKGPNDSQMMNMQNKENVGGFQGPNSQMMQPGGPNPGMGQNFRPQGPGQDGFRPGGPNQGMMGQFGPNKNSMGSGGMNLGNMGMQNMGPAGPMQNMGPGGPHQSMGPGNPNQNMGPGCSNMGQGPNQNMGPGGPNQNMGPGGPNQNMGPGQGGFNQDIDQRGPMNQRMGPGGPNQGPFDQGQGGPDEGMMQFNGQNQMMMMGPNQMGGGPNQMGGVPNQGMMMNQQMSRGGSGQFSGPRFPGPQNQMGLRGMSHQGGSNRGRGPNQFQGGDIPSLMDENFDQQDNDYREDQDYRGRRDGGRGFNRNRGGGRNRGGNWNDDGTDDWGNSSDRHGNQDFDGRNEEMMDMDNRFQGGNQGGRREGGRGGRRDDRNQRGGFRGGRNDNFGEGNFNEGRKRNFNDGPGDTDFRGDFSGDGNLFQRGDRYNSNDSPMKGRGRGGRGEGRGGGRGGGRGNRGGRGFRGGGGGGGGWR